MWCGMYFCPSFYPCRGLMPHGGQESIEHGQLAWSHINPHTPMSRRSSKVSLIFINTLNVFLFFAVHGILEDLGAWKILLRCVCVCADDLPTILGIWKWPQIEKCKQSSLAAGCSPKQYERLCLPAKALPRRGSYTGSFQLYPISYMIFQSNPNLRLIYTWMNVRGTATITNADLSSCMWMRYMHSDTQRDADA